MKQGIVQKTFRETPETLKRLDLRAQQESILAGKEVSSSDIIRRGLQWALSQPLEGAPSVCNVTQTAGGDTLCLTCRAYLFPGQACPRTGGKPRG